MLQSTGGDPPLNFGREPSRRCSGLQCTSCTSAFKNQRLVAADDATFVARIGPSGAQRGYMGITGEWPLCLSCLKRPSCLCVVCV